MSDDVLAEASQEIIKGLRAGMQVAEFLSRRRQQDLARAERRSVEDEQRVRQFMEGERRLAAPVYRSALDKGWWETATAEQAAHVYSVAGRFAQLDPEAARAVAECERQVQVRWGIDLSGPHQALTSQDVDPKLLAAAAPSIPGEERENWGQRLDEAAQARTEREAAGEQRLATHADQKAVHQSGQERSQDAGTTSSGAGANSTGSRQARNGQAAATGLARDQASVARARTGLEAGEAREALYASGGAPTATTSREQADVSRAQADETAWDSQAAREAWAQQQLDAGAPPEAVRAAVTGQQALHEPASRATRAPSKPRPRGRSQGMRQSSARSQQRHQ